MITLSSDQNKALYEMQKFLVSHEPEFCLSGYAGTGKCQKAGTEILMHDGSIKVVEDIVVGDLLMGPDSRPRRVTSLATGKDTMYEVSGHSDAFEPHVFNSVHVLSLKYSFTNAPGSVKRGVPAGTKGDLFEIPLDKFMELPTSYKKWFKLWKTGVEFSPQVVEFDPYLLGLWLGDGNSQEPILYICDKDLEVKEFIHSWASESGYKVKAIPQAGCTKLRICRPGSSRRVPNPLRRFISSNGKRIPTQYLRNSRETRLALLAGLLDTDGHLSGANTYELVIKCTDLAKEVKYLCRSLGFAVSHKKKTGTIKSLNFSGVYNRLHISGDTACIPCLVERKKASPRKQIKDPLVTAPVIKKVGKGRYYGFTLGGTDGLYLLGDFTVTHNTTVMQHLLKANPRVQTVLTAPTNKASRVLGRMASEAGVVADVMTTYSLLGLKMDKDGEAKQIRRGVSNKLSEYSLVVVDESSMINLSLRGFLREASHMQGVKIIYMGDPLQLPPVNETSSLVFLDNMPGSTLTDVVRQAHENPIIAATEEIRRCIANQEIPVFHTKKNASGGFHVLPYEKWLHWLSAGFNSQTYENDYDAFRAVAWTNRTVGMLNRRVRTILYPGADPAERFRVGERVIAASPVFDGDTDDLPGMVTDQEATVDAVEIGPHPLYQELFGVVYNLTLVTDTGDTVCCSAVHPDGQDKFNAECDKRAVAARGNKNLWGNFWEFKELHADLRPCHALTVHRSQGSTYGTVFVHMGDILKNRNTREALQCLYVAVSRASKNVILTLGD